MPFDAADFVETKPSVADVLRRARALIDTPEKWCQHHSQVREALCIGGAIIRAAAAVGRYESFTGCTPAMVVMDRVTGCTPMWNDRAGRTHAEVMGALDMAIFLAEREQC